MFGANTLNMANSTCVGHTGRVLGFPDVSKKKLTPAQKARRKKLKPEQRNALLMKEMMMKKRTVKYFDTDLLAVSSTTTVSSTALSIIPQGVTQSERVADTVFIQRVDIRMNLTTANADVFNLARFIFFIWWQNSASVSPNPNSIVESSATYGPYSMLNFEGREYFSVLRDITFNMTGVVASPTPNSQHFYTDAITLSDHRIDFNTGVTNGTGMIYLQNYSDSSVAPWPEFNLVVRFYYSDE